MSFEASAALSFPDDGAARAVAPVSARVHAMRFRFAALLLVLAGAPEARAQFTPTFTLGGTGTVETSATQVAPDGSVYVAGGFTGALTVGAETVTASADADAFVAKFESDGDLVWVRTMDGVTDLPAGFSMDAATTLALGTDGGVYVGGTFVKTLTVRDGMGGAAAVLTEPGTNANLGAFLVRYDGAGTVLWTRGGGGGVRPNGTGLDSGGADAVLDLAADGAGGVVVSGTASGTGSFLGTAFAALPASVPTVAVARVTSAGTVSWLVTGTSVNNTNGRAIAVGGTRVYVLGTFQSDLTLGSVTFPASAEADDEDTFIAALALADGTLDWGGYLGGAGDVEVKDVAADGAGAFYLTGIFVGQLLTYDPTDPASDNAEVSDSYDGFLDKYTADGEWRWTHTFGSLLGADDYAEGLAVQVSGGLLHLAGRYNNDVTFFEQDGVTLDGDPDDRSAFAATFSPGGTLLWARRLATSGLVGRSYVSTMSNDLLPVSFLSVQYAVGGGTARLITTEAPNETATSDVTGYTVALPALRVVAAPGTGTALGLNDGTPGGSSVTFTSIGTAATFTSVSESGTAPLNVPGGADAVQRRFHLAAETSGGDATGVSATVRLCYLDGELGGLSENDLRLYRFDGATWNLVPSTPDPAVNCVTATGVTAFSEWGISGGASALPVELVSFEARADGPGRVRLTWATAGETDNAGWGVELRRGPSGAAWTEAAFVAGAGTTSEARRYAHTLDGIDGLARLRVRLRQTDTDGTVAYSPEVEVALDAGLSLGLPAPNPARGGATLRFSLARAAHVRLVVYDALGREVAVLADGAFEAGTHTAVVPATLASGTHIVRMLTDGPSVPTRRLTVVR